MTSKLELVLLHDKSSKGNISSTLCKHLDDGTSLHSLRATSITLKSFADVAPERLWGVLHMQAPLRSTDKIFTVDPIAPSCHTLTINVQIPTKAEPVPERAALRQSKSTKSSSSTLELLPTQDLYAYEVDRQLWTHAFKQFQGLKNLTLRVDGDPAWPDRGDVEFALTNIRCSLERAGLRNLRSLCLSPIHICGILHLRWSSFGALMEVASPKICSRLWQSITLLDIRLSSPTYTNKLTNAQRVMSTKILQDYLRSFARSIRYLRFVWLDGDGPSPILLDEEPGMENIQRLFWPALQELHFGNVTAPNRTIQAIPNRMPHIKVLKALRSTHRFSRVEEREAWMDIDIERTVDRRGQVTASRASSLYSQTA